MKLLSGKQVKLKIPTIEELKNFSLKSTINIIEPLIEIGKCKNCGESLTINIKLWKNHKN